MRSWLRIGWILQCLKQEIEDQYWRTDCRRRESAQGTSQSRISETRWRSQVFQRYVEASISSMDLRVFSFRDFVDFPEQEQEILIWISWRDSAEWRKTTTKSQYSRFEIVRYQRSVTRHTDSQSQKIIFIQWKLDNTNAHWCKWSVWRSKRKTHKHTFSSQNECSYLYPWSSEISVCGIILYVEKINGESFTLIKWTRR